MGLRRRNPQDPFGRTDLPHRLLVEDRVGRVLEQRDVPAGSDLRKAIEDAAGYWEAAGWLIEREGGRFRYPSFFMTKAGERRHVYLAPAGGGYGQTSDMFRPKPS